MSPKRVCKLSLPVHALALLLVASLLPVYPIPGRAHDVKDLKYGVVLYEFYQKRYFETLVEYAYADARGGIQNHGSYPELLKGGVSLSYGLDLEAQDIFSRLISTESPKEVQNRAWFYLAKMLYLRGEVAKSANALSNIAGKMPEEIDAEYRYLAALINLKLEYFEQVHDISKGLPKHSVYTPYLYFNLGVALGKQKQYDAARTALTKAASYASKDGELASLADRAHMAIAYLEEEQNNIGDTYLEIQKVSTSGVFSNRALLGSGWASVNTGDFARALPPLTVLQGRSMAIPEVQEAVLLVPHVYERLGLMGRAAEGFIKAYARYDEALEDLERAEQALGDADVLELFVENFDDLLSESDWFGISPTVSLNALSPYLIELMSDHSFQSVLKDLRDLYAIRHNLDAWLEKRTDFKVMIDAREAGRTANTDRTQIAAYAASHEMLSESYRSASQRAARLNDDDREKMAWMLEDVAYELKSGESMLSQLSGAQQQSPAVQGYAELVEENMRDVERELKTTIGLIEAVEGVLRKLVKAELNVHRQRLKYYRIQSHLAKVRILDRSLSERDANQEIEIQNPVIQRELADPAQERNAQKGATDDAA